MNGSKNTRDWYERKPFYILHGFFLFLIIIYLWQIFDYEYPLSLAPFSFLLATVILDCLFLVSDSKIYNAIAREFFLYYPIELNENGKIEWFLTKFSDNFNMMNKMNNPWYEFFLNLEGTLHFHFFIEGDYKSRIYIKLVPEINYIRFTLIGDTIDYKGQLDLFISDINLK